ncbi:hypothetical protein B0A48_02363 [Cryoendolithus antarcticus]|uniref:Uncharacterized protein n=1 Tax=Cryoendolithus antarcticus TaxID=1507870 RepID=A0A1V8TND8_9PEZI|nr:hypothetical protein B0A48_02363 [Cryoendolithus antarcticus]
MIPRVLAQCAMRLARPMHLSSTSPIPRLPTPQPLAIRTYASVSSPPSFGSSNKSTADAAIEHITELFATAQDEFEIAMEETEKVSVYAQADRDAAREELGKVQEAYRKVVESGDVEVAEEVKRRVGHRIRELEGGVDRMEKMAIEQD